MGILKGLQRAMDTTQKVGRFFEDVAERQENDYNNAYEKGQYMSNEDLVDAVLESGLFSASESVKKAYYHVLIERDIIHVENGKITSTHEFDRIARNLGYEKE